MPRKAVVKLYRIRDKRNGQFVCYGRSTDLLQTSDLTIAQGFIGELSDYGITAEIVPVEIMVEA